MKKEKKQFLITFIPTMFFTLFLILYIWKEFNLMSIYYLLSVAFPGLTLTIILLKLKKSKFITRFIASILTMIIYSIVILAIFYYIAEKDPYGLVVAIVFTYIILGYFVILYVSTYVFYKIATRKKKK